MLIYRATGDMVRPEAVECDDPIAHVDWYYENEDQAWEMLRWIRGAAVMKAGLSLNFRALKRQEKLSKEFARNYAAWLSSQQAGLPGVGSSACGNREANE